MFCTNASQQSHRRRLLLQAWLDDYLHERQRGRSAICSIDDKWNGVTLALIVDHVNGDPSNNRRENSGRCYRRQRYAYGQSY